MILVDTSIWVDLFNKGDRVLQQLLQDGQVSTHPLVIGELAMGNLHPRQTILKTLSNLPQSGIASHTETLQLVSAHRLFGLGIGYIDAQLLAAARLTTETFLWTRDKKLSSAAERLGVAFHPA